MLSFTFVMKQLSANIFFLVVTLAILFLVFEIIADQLKPTNGSINITVNSGTSEAFLDNKDLGKTPLLAGNLKIGNHQLSLKKPDSNETAWEGSVFLSSDVVTYVTVDLGGPKLFNASDILSLTPGSESISLLSQPEDCSITVDDKKIGTTPKDFDLAPGVHSLVLKKNGYLSREVDINIEKNYRLNLIVSLAVDPFPVVNKIDSSSKLSLFSIFNPSIKLSNSFADWAKGIGAIQNNLNSTSTKFDYLIDENGKTYTLDEASWKNKLASKAPANIGYLASRDNSQLSAPAAAVWNSLKTSFQ